MPMTEEQEKTIKRCEELIKPEHANWIGISNQEAIRELLNILKEKDKKIASKNRLLQIVGIELNEAETKIEEKDEEIDLMAEHIQNGCDFDNRIKTKEEVKQYFKSKATNDG